MSVVEGLFWGVCIAPFAIVVAILIPVPYLIWILCGVLGVLTVAFTPLLIGTVVRLLSGYARKYPALTDVVATITVIVVGAAMIAMSAVFAAVYHHLLMGTP